MVGRVLIIFVGRGGKVEDGRKIGFKERSKVKRRWVIIELRVEFLVRKRISYFFMR